MKRECSIRQHARQRAKQRFGVDLSRNDVKNIIGDIQSNRAVYVGDKNNGEITYWYVLPHWSETPVAVVYSERRKEVITFLPEFKERDKVALCNRVLAAKERYA